MANHFERQIGAKVAHGDESENPTENIQDIYVLIVRERDRLEEDQAQIVDSRPAKIKPLQAFDYVTLCIALICCLPMLASIFLQV